MMSKEKIENEFSRYDRIHGEYPPVAKLDLITPVAVKSSFPTTDEIIQERARQVNDWLDGSTESEKQHYLVGFRRGCEYVIKNLK